MVVLKVLVVVVVVVVVLIVDLVVVVVVVVEAVVVVVVTYPEKHSVSKVGLFRPGVPNSQPCQEEWGHLRGGGD